MKYIAIGFGWAGIGLVIGITLSVNFQDKKEKQAIASGWISLDGRPFKITEVKP